MYFWISNAPITAVFFILRQFVVFIKVYLYLSHEATDAKKTLKYERGREIASDRNANDHNYLCVYSENCSEEFCSSVVKRWSDKHNNDASANNHGENQVTEVKYNLISATFPLQIHNWYPTVNNCTYKMLRNRKTRGDKNLMWLYVKQTGKDRKQKRGRERIFWESRYIFHSTGCNNGKQRVFGFRKNKQNNNTGRQRRSNK